MASCISHIFRQLNNNTQVTDKKKDRAISSQPPDFREKTRREFSFQVKRDMTSDAFTLKGILDTAFQSYTQCPHGFDIDFVRSLVILLNNGNSEILTFEEYLPLLATLNEFEMAFRANDSNKNGTASLQELRQMLSSVDMDVGDNVLQAVAVRFGNEDGEIFRQDFLTVCMRLLLLYDETYSSEERNKGNYTSTEYASQSGRGQQPSPYTSGNNQYNYQQQSGHQVPYGYGQSPPPYEQRGGVQAYGPPPGVDPQVWSWFRAVDVDQNGLISTNELRQALVNANWTLFNEETCRLMVGMFDRDNNGQIDIMEFNAMWTYIQQWRGVFEKYDTDRSGFIDVMELQKAFSDMGYRLSHQFAETVIMRFDRHQNRGLSLDSFIQACVQLHGLTESFKQRDSSRTGNICVNYEDFLTMVLTNKV